MNMAIQPYPFNAAAFKSLVEKHWTYHRICHHLNWRMERVGEKLMQFEAAPVYQDVLGGAGDGMRVWSAYSMRLSEFLADPDIDVIEFSYQSYCVECAPTALFGVRGRYKGQEFLLKLHLEPIPNSEPVEVIDTLKNETRAIKERQQ